MFESNYSLRKRLQTSLNQCATIGNLAISSGFPPPRAFKVCYVNKGISFSMKDKASPEILDVLESEISHWIKLGDIVFALGPLNEKPTLAGYATVNLKTIIRKKFFTLRIDARKSFDRIELKLIKYSDSVH